MKRHRILALALLSSFNAAATAHDAADAGWFLRAGTGVSNTEVDLPFPDILLHPRLSTFDHTDLALSLDGGYRFANGFGLALGYHDRGALDYHTPSELLDCPLDVCIDPILPEYTGEIGAKDWRLGVDYRIGLGEHWSLAPGLAAASVDAEVTYAEGDPPGEAERLETNHWRVVPSLTAAYAFDPRWAIDAQLEYLGEVGDHYDSERFSVTTLTIGLSYSFQ